MRTLRIPASAAFAAGVITPALVDEDGGSCGNAPRARWMAEETATRRATEVCLEVRGAKAGLRKDPVTGMVIKTGGASR